MYQKKLQMLLQIDLAKIICK